MAPLVSILITNYNYDEFIGEAIESSLSQSYGNIEMLVIDDGSTDGSLAGIERRRLSAVLLPVSNGDIICICFLDSDDYFYANKVATIAEIIARLDNSKPINGMDRPHSNRVNGKCCRNAADSRKGARHD